MFEECDGTSQTTSLARRVRLLLRQDTNRWSCRDFFLLHGKRRKPLAPGGVSLLVLFGSWWHALLKMSAELFAELLHELLRENTSAMVPSGGYTTEL
jgi:hypothetical protein